MLLWKWVENKRKLKIWRKKHFLRMSNKFCRSKFSIKLDYILKTLSSQSQSLTIRVIIKYHHEERLRDKEKIFIYKNLLPPSPAQSLNAERMKKTDLFIMHAWIIFQKAAWGREEEEHKSFVWGITMSDKLDFMSERVTAISRPFIVIILAENLLHIFLAFFICLPLWAHGKQLFYLRLFQTQKIWSSSKLKLTDLHRLLMTACDDNFFCFHWCEKLIKDKSELLQQQQSSCFPSLIHIYIFSHRIEAPESFYPTKKSLFISSKKQSYVIAWIVV